MDMRSRPGQPTSTRLVTRLLTLLLVILALLTPALARPHQAYAASTVSFSIKGKVDYTETYKFLSKLNKLRKSKGLSALTMDATLLKHAEQRAFECAISYSHTRPDDTQWSTIIGQFTGSIGENIAYGMPTLSASQAYSMWKNSPGHYQNMIGASYRSCGICCVERDGSTYWVNLFSSSPATAVKKPANATKKHTVRIAKSYLTAKNIAVVAPDLRVGKTGVPKVYFFAPTSAAYNAVPLPAKYFSYKVKSTSIAKVATNGKMTGKKAGKTKLYVTLKAKTSCKANTTVTVTK